MSWKDLLRMSLSNLKRRRLRTFLTVLGVLIAVAVPGSGAVRRPDYDSRERCRCRKLYDVFRSL